MSALEVVVSRGTKENTRDNASRQLFHVERRPRMRTALRRELHPRPQRDCALPQLLFSVTATATADAALATFTRRKTVPWLVLGPVSAVPDRKDRALGGSRSHDPRRSTTTPRLGVLLAPAMARRPPHFFSILVAFKVSLPSLAGDSTLAG